MVGLIIRVECFKAYQGWQTSGGKSSHYKFWSK